MSYTLVLKALLEREDADLSMLADKDKENFERAADELFEREYYYEAARGFALLGLGEKLSRVGSLCLVKKNLQVAYFAFKKAGDREGLDKTGEAFLEIPDVKAALACFEVSGNEAMVSFIRANF